MARPYIDIASLISIPIVSRISGLWGSGSGRQRTPWIRPCRLGGGLPAADTPADRYPTPRPRHRFITCERYISLASIVILSSCGGGGGGSSNTATTNVMPTIIDQNALAIAADTNLAISLQDITVSDPDNVFPDDFTLTVQPGANFSVQGNTVAPAPGFTGTLTVPVTVNDGRNTSPTFNLSVIVTDISIFEPFQKADIVIGQSDFSSNTQNQGAPAPDATVVSDPNGRPSVGSLYVPDTFDNRVLIFDEIPSSNNTPAHSILGQDDASAQDSGTSATKFSSPKGTWIDKDKFILVDSKNNRVLIWNSLPTGNTPADTVLGQPDFMSGQPNQGTMPGANSMNDPTSVVVAGGKLIVSDSGNNRVLIWNSIPTNSNAGADIVVGQVDFSITSSSRSRQGLNDPRSIWSDGVRLVIADNDNHRVLIWNHIPPVNGPPADLVIGQPDFTTAEPRSGQRGLNGPSGVYSNGVQLLIADRDNHRILIYDTFPTSDNAQADITLGQQDFTNHTPNDDNQDGIEDATPSARTFNRPSELYLNGKQLLIMDSSNNRVLIFNGR